MLLSRFWYVVLALLLGGAVFVLFIATSMYNRSSARNIQERLSSDAQVVSWYLKNDARERSSQLVKFALNRTVAKNLATASKSETKVKDSIRSAVEKQLEKVNQGIAKEHAFDAVFAVDQHGRVVAHLGYEQASGMEDFELGGYPVVADALHGYIRDDTLVLDRIYRVVARPVEFEAGTMPAGAIVGARIIDDRFARELSDRTGAAVAFYAQGQRVASGAPEGFDASQLDQIVSDLDNLASDKNYQEKGRSQARELGTMLWVQYTRLPGESYALGAGYAVGRLPAHVDSPLGFFDKADDKDKESVKLWVVAVVVLLGAGLGLLFSFLEHTRPLQVFRTEAQRMAKGESDQLAPSRFRGVYRKIASDLNDGVEKVAAKGGAPRRAADLTEVLGDIPDQPQMSAFSFPGDSGAASGPVSSVGAISSSAPKTLPKPKRLPVPPGGKRPVLDQTMPEAGSGVTHGNGSGNGNGSASGNGNGADPSPQMDGWGAGNPEESEWQNIYGQFVSLKQQCGENTEGFTYDKFEQTLRKNRDTLMNRHGAKRVKFSVYVKDGKAALKASPIKD